MQDEKLSGFDRLIRLILTILVARVMTKVTRFCCPEYLISQPPNSIQRKICVSPMLYSTSRIISRQPRFDIGHSVFTTSRFISMIICHSTNNRILLVPFCSPRCSSWKHCPFIVIRYHFSLECHKFSNIELTSH